MALVRAALYGVAFVSIFFWAVFTPTGQEMDAASLGAFSHLRESSWLEFYGARDWLTILLIMVAGIVILVGLIRRRTMDALRAAFLLLTVFLACELLETGIVKRPFLGDWAYPENTFPSGHTAMALAAVVAVFWVVSAWRNAAALAVGGVLTIFVAAASVLSFAHRASDVFGGVLVVGLAAALLRTDSLSTGPARTAGIRARHATVILLAVVVVAVPASIAISIDAFGLVLLVGVIVLVSIVLVAETEVGSRDRAGAGLGPREDAQGM